ncbi:hypothetical protein RHMOL_Rhmol01G0128800 [Rhododendron molle]|uniref:Uncharacterized protein n=1 Tax=Rhododendron molle TaxID=49168 RepID=A0ACC0Q474_RHOML|nr:hypothetical protein RHMOL_Rhmol01G0128800 [Rhododendron molle]
MILHSVAFKFTTRAKKVRLDEAEDGHSSDHAMLGLTGQSSQATIGIKRMGDLDSKPFHIAAKRLYGKEADSKAMELCSLWDAYLRDPSWHPFKIIRGSDEEEEIIDEDDEKLKTLKNELGDEVYSAVTIALVEANEYNPRDRMSITFNATTSVSGTSDASVSYPFQVLVLQGMDAMSLDALLSNFVGKSPILFIRSVLYGYFHRIHHHC